MSAGENPCDAADEGALSPAETRRALWTAAIAWGVFGSAWLSLITGAPFANFARSLGASTFMFGLLSSLPFLGVLTQLSSAYLVEKTGRRRRLFLLCASGQRVIWFAIAALPWAIPETHVGARVGCLLGLVILASALGNAGTPAWLSWLADFVPEQIRGRYLGNRAALGTVTAVVAATAVGWVLDRNSSFTAFTIIFSIAALLGLTDILLLILVREPPMERDTLPWTARDVVVTPLKQAPFRSYLLYAFSETFMFGLAGPFFWLVGLEVLDIGNFWSNFYIMILPMILTAITLPLWGAVCDRFGCKPLLTLGTLMGIAFPACWLTATSSHYHMALTVAAIVAGAFAGAVQVADLSLIFSLTPRRKRSAYIAMVSVSASLGWVVGPALGGAFAQLLKPVQVEVLDRTFVSLHLLILLSVAVRLIHCFLVIPRLPEAPKQTTGALVRHLLFWPLHHVAHLLLRPRLWP
jgi:MFS family permease